MLKLEFTHDSAEGLNAQVADYLANVKKKRGGKDEPEAGNTAPAPMPPPNMGMPAGGPAAPQFAGPGASAGFVPPGAGVAQPGPAFPVTAATGPAPEVVALVQRITAKMDAAVQSGQTDVNQMLTWFRGQCGPEAAAATLDQIKQNFLYKLTMPALEGIAKMMAA